MFVKPIDRDVKGLSRLGRATMRTSFKSSMSMSSQKSSPGISLPSLKRISAVSVLTLTKWVSGSQVSLALVSHTS